jgi:hypothetical protein
MKTTRTKTKRKKRTVITKQLWSRRAAVGLALFVFSTFAQPVAADKNQKEKPYALIFGTAYGPDDRPFYGATITVHSLTKKHPSWELVSDHRGEFAQRVPPGPGDYLIHGEAQYVLGPDGKPQKSKAKRLRGETKVHIDNDERVDISLHLTE